MVTYETQDDGTVIMRWREIFRGSLKETPKGYVLINSTEEEEVSSLKD